MPRKGYKAITVKEEVFKQAEELVKQGKATSIAQLVEKSLLEKIKETQ